MDTLNDLGDGEERYRAVIGALAEGIVLQDKQGTILASNTSAERILQMTADELHGRTSLDAEWRAIKENGTPFPGPEHPSMVTLRTGQALSNVVMGVRRGKNEPTWISINSRPLIREGATHPHAVVCSFFDITESKNLENLLKQSEERFRSVFEHSMDGLLLTRPDGSILSANPAACRMLGHRAEDLVKLRREDIVNTDDPRLIPALQERARRGRASAELTFKHADGTIFPVDITSVLFNDARGEPRTSMIFRDITDRVRMERMKSEFVSSVSHELRTPLTAIRGVLGLLGGGVLGPLPESAKTHVRMATANADRLGRLLDDILDLSLIDAGKFHLDLQSVLPNTLMVAAYEMGNSLAVAAGVDLRISVQTQIHVLVDPDRINQVLSNLISNAIKFSSPGSTVDVVVKAGRSGWVRFEVIDQGRGIEAYHINKLFKRFYQVDASDSRARGGTGLGLFISRSIVEGHGGNIGVISTLGLGSTFWFELVAQE